MKRFIKVLAIVFCLSMLTSCGNVKNTVHDDVQESQDTENTVNTIMSTSYVSYTKQIFEVIKMPELLENSRILLA